jgi:N-methylhydantoinase A/oxoprolinase/acetone carboxylase beta subunit
MAIGKTIRIGVDVGGTNTDAVAIDTARAVKGDVDRGVLTWKKTPTTPDATSGIEIAVRSVIESAEINPSRIASVTIVCETLVDAESPPIC